MEQTKQESLKITVDDLKDKNLLIEKLKAMSEMTFNDIDADSIVNCKNIVVDNSMPKDLRNAIYLLQIGNPFFYKTDKLIVKNVYNATTDISMHNCLVNILVEKMEQYKRDNE